MKTLKIAFAMTVLVISLISCQKDNETKDETKSVAGNWEGNFGFYGQTPSYLEIWDMEDDGELKRLFQDGTLYAVGSWDQDGDEIEVHYTLLDESYSFTYNGTYNEEEDKITGIWNNDDVPTVEGTFVMERQ